MQENMMNTYLKDSNEEAIEDFVKDHEELYDKTNEHFKDKARKDHPWERFASSCKLSVKVCKTWFISQRTHYVKLTQSKSGQACKEMTERQNWIKDKFIILFIYLFFGDPHQNEGPQQIFCIEVTTVSSQ